MRMGNDISCSVHAVIVRLAFTCSRKKAFFCCAKRRESETFYEAHDAVVLSLARYFSFYPRYSSD